MRILLINPKSKALDALPIPPLGILYLAAYARESGFTDIKVIDDNRERLPPDVLENEISQADILGLTGTTSQFINALGLSLIAKRYGVLTVYGGVHATFSESSITDITVKGEGELAFLDILRGSRERVYKYPFISDLDSLPFPARDLIPIEKYGNRELQRFDGAYTHMMTGRGCNSKCIFCSSPAMWKYPRLMSARRVFDEMLEVYNKYGFKNIHFQDDTFTLSKRRILELCDLIISSQKYQGIPFKFSCQTRPDMVDDSLLKKMKEAGCIQVEFGVESGEPRLLETAKKGYSKTQIKQAFASAHKAKIKTYGFFIVGLPGETIWTWLKSIWFGLKLRTNTVWTVLMPYPGTAVNGMVEVIDRNYNNWLYKRPIIKVGCLNPSTLTIMRNIADKIVNFGRGTYRGAKPKNEG